MEQILLVSSSEKSGQALGELLRAAGYSVFPADSGQQARRLLLQTEYPLVLINCPLSDESGCDLAVHVAETSFSGVLMLVKSGLLDKVSLRVEDAGVLVAEKPIGRQPFFQALRLAGATGRRLERLREENRRLQNKVDEIRLVSRAKCLLMQARQMDEQQAHRYIEKQAMNTRMTRKEVARQILQAYDTV